MNLNPPLLITCPCDLVQRQAGFNPKAVYLGPIAPCTPQLGFLSAAYINSLNWQQLPLSLNQTNGAWNPPYIAAQPPEVENKTKCMENWILYNNTLGSIPQDLQAPAAAPALRQSCAKHLGIF